MIFWMLFIPLTTLALILYFQYIDVVFKGKKKAFKINQEEENPTKKEYVNTFLNLILFAAIGLFVGFAINSGWTQVYSGGLNSIGNITYLIASFFITLAIHDAYFYLCHRLLHIPFIFRKIHSWHHHSMEVNAWASFSFHPIEGLFQIGIVPIVAFVLPVHENVLLLFTGFLLFISVYGHCGYELRPNKMKVFRIFNTSLHHYQHHKEVRYNFGIYLNVWDKLFKTDFPDYDDNFDALAKTIAERKS